MSKQVTSKLEKVAGEQKSPGTSRKPYRLPPRDSEIMKRREPPVTWRLPPQFRRTLAEENSGGVVLLTAYDEGQVGRIFLVAYQSDQFIAFLDALTDNGNMKCVEVIPPVGTRVVARIGINGDDRDNVPFLRKIGGIHNKPWRGVIEQKRGHNLKDSNKAWVTITDLGISEQVDVSNIFLPSKEVSSVPFDKFGSWVLINNVNITNDNRMFYQFTYRDLMDSLLYSELQIVEVNEDSTGMLKVDLKCENGANPATLVEKLQHWEYETVAKKVNIRDAKTIVEAIHGPGHRVKFDHMKPVCLPIGKNYKGTIHPSERSSTVLFFRVQEDEEMSDNIRIWDLNVCSYTNLISNCFCWYPVVDEVFLMQREVQSQLDDTNNEYNNCRWRRVMRNLSHVWDLDDSTFCVTLEEVPSSCLMRPAPNHLLNLPMGHARIRIPGYKLKHHENESENVVSNTFSLRVVSYDLDNLAHIVEVDDNDLEWLKQTWLEAA